MALKIISADERLAQKSAIKGVIAGIHGIGKTTLARTLPPEDSLFINMEAGTLALGNWGGGSVDILDWLTAKNFACYLRGPNPAMRPDQSYSQQHYDYCVKEFDGLDLSKYNTIFVDSITVASRLCFNWSLGQPEAFSEKTGKPDRRGAYGLLGQEMLGWLTQIQHTQGKNIWFSVALDKKKDDFKRTYYSLQVEGGKTGLEMPGIVDQVITLAEVDFGECGKQRAFVTQTINPDGYPAKDRSGTLSLYEEPHLGKLMAKIKSGARQDGQIQTEFSTKAA